MNAALREYMQRRRESLGAILRRVGREELAAYNFGEQDEQGQA